MKTLKDLAVIICGIWAMPFMVVYFLLEIVQQLVKAIGDAPRLLAWKLAAWFYGAKLKQLRRREQLRDELGPDRPRGL